MKQQLQFVILVLVSLVMTCNRSQAQSNSALRQSYMMSTYGITAKQAQEYENLVLALKTAKKDVKNRKLSTQDYKQAMIEAYKVHAAKVTKIFSDNQYNEWNNCICQNERYHNLSEEAFTPKEKVLAIIVAENEWWNNRKKMWDSSIEESLKHKREKEMLQELNQKFCNILGQSAGEKYIEDKAMLVESIANMDKYGATFNESFIITGIEHQYSKKRKGILGVKREHYSDTEVLLAANDNAMVAAIKKVVSKELFARWNEINSSVLDYSMSKKYGLSKSQIAQFKKAYNMKCPPKVGLINI